MYCLKARNSDPPRVTHTRQCDSDSHATSISDRLVGLVVKASASRAVDLGLIPACEVGLFLRRVIPCSDFKIATPVIIVPCQGLSVIGSALGLGVSVSVHLDQVRQNGLQLLSHCGRTYNCLNRSISEIH